MNVYVYKITILLNIVDCRDENAFKCNIEGCLSPAVICDGRQDCGNNNDENFCGF